MSDLASLEVCLFLMIHPRKYFNIMISAFLVHMAAPSPMHGAYHFVVQPLLTLCLSVCVCLFVHCTYSLPSHFTHTYEGVGVVSLRKLAESRVNVVCPHVYSVHVCLSIINHSLLCITHYNVYTYTYTCRATIIS